MNFASFGGNKSAIGSGAFGLMTVPECTTGRKPDEKLLEELYGSPRGSGSTTNVGRFWLRLPRPYEIHAPIVGYPGLMKPVFCKYTPGPCTFVADCIAIRNAMSSTHVARFGNTP